jgi:hypothetical protein
MIASICAVLRYRFKIVLFFGNIMMIAVFLTSAVSPDSPDGPATTFAVSSRAINQSNKLLKEHKGVVHDVAVVAVVREGEGRFVRVDAPDAPLHCAEDNPVRMK